jgi:predicted PurR-regulated permease PerM
VWGGAIVSTIDNFLYPIIVGPQLRQHTVAVLLSILGGIALFGITGIILGPLTFTATSTLLEIWRSRSSRSSRASFETNDQLPVATPETSGDSLPCRQRLIRKHRDHED